MTPEKEELTRLQNQVFSLEQQLLEAKAEVWRLSGQLRIMSNVGNAIYKTIDDAIRHCRDYEMGYWISKCARQRRAINHIQRKGWWPPEYVIKEEDPWGSFTEA